MGNTFDAGSIESQLVLDRSEFTEGLRLAKAEGDKFAKSKFTAKLSLDHGTILPDIAEIKTELASLRDVNLNVGISGSNAQIRAISQSAGVLDGRQITMGVQINGIADASAQLRTLRQLANSLDGRTINTHVNFNSADASAQMRAYRTELRGLDGQNARTTASFNGASSAMRGGGGAMRLLLEAALYLAPALIPISAAALNVAATATVMGVAVGGAIGVFGLATMGAVKNVVALNKTLDQAKKALGTQRQALDQLKPGTNAYATQLHKVELAQEAVNKAQAAFTPQQTKFANGLVAMTGAWHTFITATQNDTLSVASIFVRSIADALPKLVPVVHALTPEVAALANQWKNWVDNGGLARLVSLLIHTGVPAFHQLRLAISSVTTFFGNMFQAFTPQVQHMATAINNGAAALARWSGTGGFVRFIDYVKTNSPQVRQFFKELGDALKNVATAMKGLGSPSLLLATTLLKIVAALPPSVIQAIVLGMFAWRTAVIGITIATTAWAIAQIALDTAMSPFFLLMAGAALTVLAVVAAIVALGVGIYYLVKYWDVVQHGLVVGWNATWGAIKTAALATWHDGLEPAYKGMMTGFHAVATAALWFWNVVLKPTFNAISIGARLLVVIIGTLLFMPLLLIFKLMRPVVLGLWTYAFKPMFNFIAMAARIWWAGVKLYFDAVIWGLKLVGTWAMWLWEHAFKPVFGFIAAAARIWWFGVKLYFDFVILGFKEVGKWAMWLWNVAIHPSFTAIAKGSSDLYVHGIKPATDAIVVAFKWVGKWAKWLWDVGIHPAWNLIETGTKKLSDGMIKVFDEMGKGIKKTWDAVKGIAAVPINFVIDTVYNHGIVSVWNTIAHAVGLDKMKLGTVGKIKFAQGGAIGGGVAGMDSVPILAMPNEHIWTAEEVKNAGGHGAVAAMRSQYSSTGKSRVAPGGPTASPHYFFGGGVIDWGKNAVSKVGNVAKGAWDATGGKVTSMAMDELKKVTRGAIGLVANPILDGLKSAMTKGIDAIIPGAPSWQSLITGTATAPIKWIKDWIKGDDAKNTPKAGVGGVIPTAQHKLVIDQALSAAHIPPPGDLGQWEAGLNVLIGRESGWNPNAVNRTDINAQQGHPSQGLAQTIPGTFAQYVPASLRARGILDPVANVAAAARYIIARYGSILNVPQADPNHPPQGYFGGGVTVPGVHLFGEKGPELVATSGGDRVFTASDTDRMLKGASGGSSTTINFPDRFVLKVGEREFLAMLDDETRATMADVLQEADRSR